MRTYLVPGVNVDLVDIDAGLRQARRFGYHSREHLMVAEHALRRHARGEEDGAQRSALSGGIDLTSWYAILAAAMAAAAQVSKVTVSEGNETPGFEVQACVNDEARGRQT